MLSIRLHEETEEQLANILAHKQTDNSNLLQCLIAEHWLTLQACRTLVERLRLTIRESSFQNRESGHTEPTMTAKKYLDALHLVKCVPEELTAAKWKVN